MFACLLVNLFLDYNCTFFITIYVYSVHIVEDICPQVSFKSKKSKASIGYIIMLVAKQLISLNLSGCNITDQGADMIAAVLLETVSLKNVDLSNAMLNSIKAIKISDALKKISSLEVFNISSNDIDDRATDSIYSSHYV